jgi:two-component system chemotaxis response regulator CheB
VLGKHLSLETNVNKVRVLVVDDSLTIRAILEDILEKSRNCHVVGVASNVEEARRLMLAEQPDAVTLDLEMPGTDGFTFLDELAEHGRCAIVVISSLTAPGSAVSQEVISRGAAGYFEKSRLMSEAPRLLKVLERLALHHQRSRLAELEQRFGA